MFALHLISTNDTNGNPRRAYLVCGPHGPVVCVEEGYAGRHAIVEAGYPDSPVVGTIEVKPAELKRQRKLYPAKPSAGRPRAAFPRR